MNAGSRIANGEFRTRHHTFFDIRQSAFDILFRPPPLAGIAIEGFSALTLRPRMGQPRRGWGSRAEDGAAAKRVIS